MSLTRAAERIRSLSNRIIKEKPDFRSAIFGPIDGSSAKEPDTEFTLIDFDAETSGNEDSGHTESTGEDRIADDARAQAERIIAGARQEAARIRQQAIREGYAEGLASAQQKAKAEAEEAFKEKLGKFEKDAGDALNDISGAKEKVLSDYLGELVQISLAVAEKVIHVSLSTSGDVIARMICAEVEKRRKTAWIKIYIDKQDYGMMEQSDADAAEELGKISDNVKFVVVDNEKPGYCIIETPEEITDISVDTQFSNLQKSLDRVTFGETNV